MLRSVRYHQTSRRRVGVARFGLSDPALLSASSVGAIGKYIEILLVPWVNLLLINGVPERRTSSIAHTVVFDDNIRLEDKKIRAAQPDCGLTSYY